MWYGYFLLMEQHCAPFNSQDEWELAQWLLRNVGHNATEDFLKLPIVSSCYQFITNITAHIYGFTDLQKDRSLVQK